MSKLCFAPQGLFNVLLSKVWELQGISLISCQNKKVTSSNFNSKFHWQQSPIKSCPNPSIKYLFLILRCSPLKPQLACCEMLRHQGEITLDTTNYSVCTNYKPQTAKNFKYYREFSFVQNLHKVKLNYIIEP